MGSSASDDTLTSPADSAAAEIEAAYDKARLVTADPKRPIPGFFWTRDSKKILFVQDKDGDENYNVYAVDPAAAKIGLGMHSPTGKAISGRTPRSTASQDRWLRLPSP